LVVTTQTGEKHVVFKLGETLDEVTFQIAQLVLDNNAGNAGQTARTLGLSPGTVKNWIKLGKVRRPDRGADVAD
jgi:DNA-binding NtrC family response regulator